MGKTEARRGAGRPPAERPNIILVNADDLGYGDLGCTGHAQHRTPHLDRLAAEGMRFTDFYQGSPVCSPSRGALLTGCHPRRIGFDRFDGPLVLFPGQGVGLNPSEITFATLLRRAGYATCHVGKWHCGDQPAFLPTRHGFDRYYGLPYSNDMGRQVGREQGVPLPLLRDEAVIEEQPDQASLTARYVEESVRFMRENRDRPFLLYLAHLHVHLPLYVAPRFEAESRNGRYGAAVASIDWAMGVLLHELRQLGLDDHTLVLFTSDNGSRCDFGPSNGPLRGRKGTCWEGGLRVPLLARWPGQVPAGAVCRELATGMDLLPTFATLAGVEPPRDRTLDGRDIGPLLRGTPGATSPHAAFFYYLGDNLDAVRAGRWKLHVARHTWVSGETGLCELYDLHDDLGETVNVAAQHPEVVRDLQTRLDACRADLGDGSAGASGANLRPLGRVPDPQPLTRFDPNHPYYIALYDLKEIG